MTFLNNVELRILGSLIEKQISTPEYYPLTLNALTNACNQKNNRDPVVLFEETTVVRGLDELREKSLCATVTGAGMRVPKYKQKLTETYSLNDPQIAALCVLMLRGQQTVGEIRSRGGMFCDFKSLDEVEATLATLIERLPDPLVVKLSRQAGQKEIRYMHLLSGEPSVEPANHEVRPEIARLQVISENARLNQLEEIIKSLQTQIEELQKQFIQFKQQFE